ncbi:YraN family protein [uncultured Corynebacterium sp.]|uniref:YraN family protein n=1 Tax=uncultured Corynebacterium sp. TaxID=159447 RepID=UPI0025D305D6|nr:YraN family protein [uncultured Corynebacterium sp.]
MNNDEQQRRHDGPDERGDRGKPAGRSATKRLGDDGERAAVTHLTERGLRLIDVNVRVARDELDAVFADGDVIVVVEVKTRSTAMMGTGLESVTPAKLRRMRRAIAGWLRERDVGWAGVRFDVVEVVPVGGEFGIEWFRDVA